MQLNEKKESLNRGSFFYAHDQGAGYWLVVISQVSCTEIKKAKFSGHKKKLQFPVAFIT